MRQPRPCFLALLILALLTAPAAHAVRIETVAIPPQNVPGSRMPTQPISGFLQLPDGKGPFPAMIVLHGCGGRGQPQLTWAVRLNSWGYAALVLDSFGSRGVYGGVCPSSMQHLVTPQDRAGDVLSAGVWLRTRPDIDGARIGVIGFSHGGATAAWVTQRRYEELDPGLLKASVDYYGSCRSPETQGMVPLLVLAGDDDTWGYTAMTCHAFGGKLRPGQVFELHTYPGVVHAFDSEQTPYRVVKEGHPLQYDRAAAEDSYMRVKAFLDRYVAAAKQ